MIMLMLLGCVWLAGGILLHFSNSLPFTIQSWIVLVVLIILSGMLLFAGQKSQNPDDAPGSDDASASATGPSNTNSETAASSGSGKNWLITLLVVGVIGGMIWWVSTLPTSSSYTVSGLVYEDNGKKFVTFDIPKRWQQNSCFSLDTIINAKVVTIAGVDEVIKISPTNGRCWGGEKKVRHVTFRLADKSVSRVSVTFEKK
jgi:hypothetical protein